MSKGRGRLQQSVDAVTHTRIYRIPKPAARGNQVLKGVKISFSEYAEPDKVAKHFLAVRNPTYPNYLPRGNGFEQFLLI
jgi:hypothetical protein